MKTYWWEVSDKKPSKVKINKDISNAELIQEINNLKQKLATEQLKNQKIDHNHSKRANQLLKNIENLTLDYSE